MRNIILLFYFLISTQTLLTQTNWEWIAPNPPTRSVYSSSVSGNYAYLWCHYNNVMKLHFETDSVEMLPLYAEHLNCAPGDFSSQGIAFADSLTGYITDICHGEFKTTDGGQTWEGKANPYTSGYIVAFGSSQIGWKIYGGAIYRTNNAGESWNFIGTPYGGWGDGGIISGMYAFNQNQLWVLKRTYYNGAGAGIWYSSNSGFRWTAVETGIQSDSLNQVSFHDMQLSASGKGYVVGSILRLAKGTYDAILLNTLDSGKTWTSKIFSDERYIKVHIIDDKNIIILGSSNATNNFTVIQRKTTDGGNTWEFSLPLSEYRSNFYDLSSVYSEKKDAIYIFTTGGIYKSIDRGRSYLILTSELSVAVSDVVFDSKPNDTNAQLGIAWLKFNTKPYLISFDAGKNWQKKSLPASMGYIWSVGIAEEVIYMITDQDKLFKSTDFGETWMQLFLPVYSGLQALSVFNKDVFVLAAFKYLISSSDGGQSFISGPIQENVWMRESSIVEPGFITGVGRYYDSTGERGFIYRTTDYGYSWHIQDKEYIMLDIKMIDKRIGFALSEKKLYKTTNGAHTWNIILHRDTGWQQRIISMAFLDSLYGVVETDEGVKTTTDGGNTWIKRIYRLPIPPEKMQFNAKGDLFIMGQGSMIKIPSLRSTPSETGIPNQTTESNGKLFASYPNPFNNSTVIRYSITDNSYVELKIYNSLGEEIATLVKEVKSMGDYDIVWNAGNLPSGVYLYRIRIVQKSTQAKSVFEETKKMILLR